MWECFTRFVIFLTEQRSGLLIRSSKYVGLKELCSSFCALPAVWPRTVYVQHPWGSSYLFFLKQRPSPLVLLWKASVTPLMLKVENRWNNQTAPCQNHQLSCIWTVIFHCHKSPGWLEWEASPCPSGPAVSHWVPMHVKISLPPPEAEQPPLSASAHRSNAPPGTASQRPLAGLSAECPHPLYGGGTAPQGWPHHSTEQRDRITLSCWQRF